MEDDFTNNSFLRQLADKSGGRFFDVGSSDLNKTVNLLTSELSHSYSLAYYPSTPIEKGGGRKIKVELNNKKASLRYKRAYDAKLRMAQ